MYNASTGRRPQSNVSSFELLLCGAAAGCVGRLATAPLDRVRILVNESKAFVPPTACGFVCRHSKLKKQGVCICKAMSHVI